MTLRSSGKQISALFTRAVAVITAQCFLFSFVISPAAQAALEGSRPAAGIPGILALPHSVGRITQASARGSRQVVINIQDLHCHPEAQRNIARILALLDEKYGLSRVYIEGGAGPVDTSWVTSIDNPKLRGRIVESLVSDGRLSGGEYYSIISGKYGLLSGLEDEPVYAGNALRLQQIIGAREETGRIIGEMRRSLEPLRDRYYGIANRKFLAAVSSFKKGGMPARRYYRLLAKYARELDVDIRSYRNLHAFMQLMQAQEGLDYPRVSAQMKAFIGSLKGRVPYSVYRELIQKAGDAERLDELYLALSAISREYRLDLARDYAELDEFFRFIEANRYVNPLAMVREENRLLNELRDRLSESVSEREIVFLSYFISCLEDYAGNRISADDYKYFRARLPEFKTLWEKYTGGAALARLEPYAGVLDEFYRVNIERNDIFLRNALGELPVTAPETRLVPDADPAGEVLASLGAGRDIIVMVTGGFHTQGLAGLLRERDISYLVITPNITRDTGFAEQVYAELAGQQARIAAQTMALIAFSLLLARQKAGEKLPYILVSFFQSFAEQALRAPFMADAGRDPAQVAAKLNEGLDEVARETGAPRESLGAVRHEAGVYVYERDGQPLRFTVGQNGKITFLEGGTGTSVARRVSPLGRAAAFFIRGLSVVPGAGELQKRLMPGRRAVRKYAAAETAKARAAAEAANDGGQALGLSAGEIGAIVDEIIESNFLLSRAGGIQEISSLIVSDILLRMQGDRASLLTQDDRTAMSFELRRIIEEELADYPFLRSEALDISIDPGRMVYFADDKGSKKLWYATYSRDEKVHRFHITEDCATRFDLRAVVRHEFSEFSARFFPGTPVGRAFTLYLQRQTGEVSPPVRSREDYHAFVKSVARDIDRIENGETGVAGWIYGDIWKYNPQDAVLARLIDESALITAMEDQIREGVRSTIERMMPVFKQLIQGDPSLSVTAQALVNPRNKLVQLQMAIGDKAFARLVEEIGPEELQNYAYAENTSTVKWGIASLTLPGYLNQQIAAAEGASGARIENTRRLYFIHNVKDIDPAVRAEAERNLQRFDEFVEENYKAVNLLLSQKEKSRADLAETISHIRAMFDLLQQMYPRLYAEDSPARERDALLRLRALFDAVCARIASLKTGAESRLPAAFQAGGSEWAPGALISEKDLLAAGDSSGIMCALHSIVRALHKRSDAAVFDLLPHGNMTSQLYTRDISADGEITATFGIPFADIGGDVTARHFSSSPIQIILKELTHFSPRDRIIVYGKKMWLIREQLCTDDGHSGNIFVNLDSPDKGGLVRFRWVDSGADNERMHLVRGVLNDLGLTIESMRGDQIDAQLDRVGAATTEEIAATTCEVIILWNVLQDVDILLRDLNYGYDRILKTPGAIDKIINRWKEHIVERGYDVSFRRLVKAASARLDGNPWPVDFKMILDDAAGGTWDGRGEYETDVFTRQMDEGLGRALRNILNDELVKLGLHPIPDYAPFGQKTIEKYYIAPVRNAVAGKELGLRASGVPYRRKNAPAKAVDGAAGKRRGDIVGAAMKCLAGAPGIQCGKAVIVDDLSQASGDLQGKILITKILRPEDFKSITDVNGVVVIKGDPTSHAFIDLRGADKPGVIATGAAIESRKDRLKLRLPDGTVINEGDIVTVDGAAGMIYNAGTSRALEGVFDAYNTIFSCHEMSKALENDKYSKYRPVTLDKLIDEKVAYLAKTAAETGNENVLKFILQGIFVHSLLAGPEANRVVQGCMANEEFSISINAWLSRIIQERRDYVKQYLAATKQKLGVSNDVDEIRYLNQMAHASVGKLRKREGTFGLSVVNDFNRDLDSIDSLTESRIGVIEGELRRATDAALRDLAKGRDPMLIEKLFNMVRMQARLGLNAEYAAGVRASLDKIIDEEVESQSEHYVLSSDEIRNYYYKITGDKGAALGGLTGLVGKEHTLPFFNITTGAFERFSTFNNDDGDLMGRIRDIMEGFGSPKAKSHNIYTLITSPETLLLHYQMPQDLRSAIVKSYREMERQLTAGEKLTEIARLISLPEWPYFSDRGHQQYLDMEGLRAKLALPAERDAFLERIFGAAAQLPDSTIGEIIARADLDPRTKPLLLQLYANYGGVNVAVRSSAEGEETKGYAGLFESDLGIRGEIALLKAVRNVWASWWTERAIEFRDYNSLDQLGVNQGVVVQKMAKSVVSGVIYGGNPSKSNWQEILIDACRGLGPGIGKVDADKIVVNAATGEVIEQVLGNKDTEFVFDEQQGKVVEVPVDPALRRQFTLTGAQIDELVRYTKTIADYYGYVADIEFTIDETGAIYILQQRILKMHDLPQGEKRIVAPEAAHAAARRAVTDDAGVRTVLEKDHTAYSFGESLEREGKVEQSQVNVKGRAFELFAAKDLRSCSRSMMVALEDALDSGSRLDLQALPEAMVAYLHDENAPFNSVDLMRKGIIGVNRAIFTDIPDSLLRKLVIKVQVFHAFSGLVNKNYLSSVDQLVTTREYLLMLCNDPLLGLARKEYGDLDLDAFNAVLRKYLDPALLLSETGAALCRDESGRFLLRFGQEQPAAPGSASILGAYYEKLKKKEAVLGGRRLSPYERKLVRLGEPVVGASLWETLAFPLLGIGLPAALALSGLPDVFGVSMGLVKILGAAWAVAGFAIAHTIVAWVHRANTIHLLRIVYEAKQIEADALHGDRPGGAVDIAGIYDNFARNKRTILALPNPNGTYRIRILDDRGLPIPYIGDRSPLQTGADVHGRDWKDALAPRLLARDLARLSAHLLAGSLFALPFAVLGPLFIYTPVLQAFPAVGMIAGLALAGTMAVLLHSSYNLAVAKAAQGRLPRRFPAWLNSLIARLPSASVAGSSGAGRKAAASPENLNSAAYWRGVLQGNNIVAIGSLADALERHRLEIDPAVAGGVLLETMKEILAATKVSGTDVHKLKAVVRALSILRYADAAPALGSLFLSGYRRCEGWNDKESGPVRALLEEAAQALVRIGRGHPAAVAYLLPVVSEDELAKAEKEYAGKTGLLTAFRSLRSSTVHKAAAARALGESPDTRHIRILRELQADAAGEVRQEAALALDKVWRGGPGASDTRELQPLLHQLKSRGFALRNVKSLKDIAVELKKLGEPAVAPVAAIRDGYPAGSPVHRAFTAVIADIRSAAGTLPAGGREAPLSVGPASAYVDYDQYAAGFPADKMPAAGRAAKRFVWSRVTRGSDRAIPLDSQGRIRMHGSSGYISISVYDGKAQLFNLFLHAATGNVNLKSRPGTGFSFASHALMDPGIAKTAAVVFDEQAGRLEITLSENLIRTMNERGIDTQGKFSNGVTWQFLAPHEEAVSDAPRGGSWLAHRAYLKYVAWIVEPAASLGAGLAGLFFITPSIPLSMAAATFLSALTFWLPHFVIRDILQDDEGDALVAFSPDVLRLTRLTAAVALLASALWMVNPLFALGPAAVLVLMHREINRSAAEGLVMEEKRVYGTLIGRAELAVTCLEILAARMTDSEEVSLADAYVDLQAEMTLATAREDALLTRRFADADDEAGLTEYLSTLISAARTEQRDDTFSLADMYRDRLARTQIGRDGVAGLLARYRAILDILRRQKQAFEHIPPPEAQGKTDSLADISGGRFEGLNQFLSGTGDPQQIRLLVLGDIHGQYNEFVRLLRSAGYIDGNLNWAAGSRTLIQIGDVMDRNMRHAGPDGAVQMYDLLEKLQTQARAAGGRVVRLLGNHELMYISGYYLRNHLKALMRGMDITYVGEEYGDRWEIANYDFSKCDYWRERIIRDIRDGRITAACQVGDFIAVHGNVVKEISRGRSIREQVDDFNRILMNAVRDDRDPDFSDEIFGKGLNGGLFYAGPAVDRSGARNYEDRQIVGHSNKDNRILIGRDIVKVDMSSEDVEKDALALLYGDVRNRGRLAWLSSMGHAVLRVLRRLTDPVRIFLGSDAGAGKRTEGYFVLRPFDEGSAAAVLAAAGKRRMPVFFVQPYEYPDGESIDFSDEGFGRAALKDRMADVTAVRIKGRNAWKLLVRNTDNTPVDAAGLMAAVKLLRDNPPAQRRLGIMTGVFTIGCIEAAADAGIDADLRERAVFDEAAVIRTVPEDGGVSLGENAIADGIVDGNADAGERERVLASAVDRKRRSAAARNETGYYEYVDAASLNDDYGRIASYIAKQGRWGLTRFVLGGSFLKNALLADGTIDSRRVGALKALLTRMGRTRPVLVFECDMAAGKDAARRNIIQMVRMGYSGFRLADLTVLGSTAEAVEWLSSVRREILRTNRDAVVEVVLSGEEALQSRELQSFCMLKGVRPVFRRLPRGSVDGGSAGRYPRRAVETVSRRDGRRIDTIRPENLLDDLKAARAASPVCGFDSGIVSMIAEDEDILSDFSGWIRGRLRELKLVREPADLYENEYRSIMDLEPSALPALSDAHRNGMIFLVSGYADLERKAAAGDAAALEAGIKNFAAGIPALLSSPALSGKRGAALRHALELQRRKMGLRGREASPAENFGYVSSMAGALRAMLEQDALRRHVEGGRPFQSAYYDNLFASRLVDLEISGLIIGTKKSVVGTAAGSDAQRKDTSAYYGAVWSAAEEYIRTAPDSPEMRSARDMIGLINARVLKMDALLKSPTARRIDIERAADDIIGELNDRGESGELGTGTAARSLANAEIIRMLFLFAARDDYRMIRKFIGASADISIQSIKDIAAAA